MHPQIKSLSQMELYAQGAADALQKPIYIFHHSKTNTVWASEKTEPGEKIIKTIHPNPKAVL